MMSLSSWLSDEQLHELLNRFLTGPYRKEDKWSGHQEKMVQQASEKIFKIEVLKDLSDEDLIERIVPIYRGVVRVPMYYKAFTGHTQKVRAALLYLLESKDDLKSKVDSLLAPEGTYNVTGLNKSFWSLFLMALDPVRNPYWNKKTEKALDALGMADWKSDDSPGQVYQKIAEAEQALVGLHPEGDLYAVDHFMHYVTVLEGKDILAQWRGLKPPTDKADKWVQKIDRWRAEHLQPERIATRQEAEGEARDLLEANLGRFDEETLRHFFDLVSTDSQAGQVRRDRYSPAFRGANANAIAQQLDYFNEWSKRLWQVSEQQLESVMDEFLRDKPIPSAGTSLPTLILYLRDPFRYNIWLESMEKGLRYLTGFSSATKRRNTGLAYLHYNEAVNKFRMQYSLEPQEIDLILWLAGKEQQSEDIEPKQITPDKFRGFVQDTFHFLAELRQNNTKKWMEANKDRYERVLREPLRALFLDVVPLIAGLDPNLETEIKGRKVLANILKRWPDAEGPYYPYLWGAFYRADRTKQTDAQLFVIVHQSHLSVGIGGGKGASDVVDNFKQNIKAHPDLFYRMISPLLAQGIVVMAGPHGEENPRSVPLSSPTDVKALGELDFVDIERQYHLTDDIIYKPDFATEIGQVFKALYPLYRFFISQDISAEMSDLLDEEIEEEIVEEEKYTLQRLQADTFLDGTFFDRVETLLLDKGQIVLYGPPGTGKTFIAKQFARHFVDKMGGEIQVIQFHPSYSYEEFVEGIRPRSDKGQLTYPVEPGIFLRICDEARRHPDSRYVLIVDEINRGSLPRIFGELLYLLEYRDTVEPVVLPYSKKRFTIPRNIYLIGTMNTADRSIALVDHALRRRFHFVPLRPDPEILRSWLEARLQEDMTWVADLLSEVNRRLEQDQVDWHLHIGHSHWMVSEGSLDEERVALIWEYSIWPTLEEYFYNRADRLSSYNFESLKSLVTSGK